MYRQVTLAALMSGTLGSPAQLEQSVGDVTAAFKLYLRKYNHGRPFVLIGHSQGSFVLEQMIRTLIDPDRALRANWCRRFCWAATCSSRTTRTPAARLRTPRLSDDPRSRLRDRVLDVRPAGAVGQLVRPHDSHRRTRVVRQPGRAPGPVQRRRSNPAVRDDRAWRTDRSHDPAAGRQPAPAATAWWSLPDSSRLGARMPAAHMYSSSRRCPGPSCRSPSPIRPGACIGSTPMSSWAISCRWSRRRRTTGSICGSAGSTRLDRPRSRRYTRVP